MAGVTGSAVALPLFAATGASAATQTSASTASATWDRVAECESGGEWASDPGNGYYGGLQLTQDDWENYGGLDYADSAADATRAQQIAVAEKILADRGPIAWPACGPLSGLTKKTGAADTTTSTDGSTSSDGTTDSTATDGTDTSGGSGDSNVSAGTGSSSGSTGSGSLDDLLPTDGSPDPADPSASTDPSASDGSATSPSTGSASSSPSASTSPSDTASSSPSASSSDDSASASSSSSPEALPAGRAVGGHAVPGGSLTAPSDDSADSADNSDELANAYAAVRDSGSSALVDTSVGRHRGGSANEVTTKSVGSTSAARHASRGSAAAQDALGDTYTVRAGDSIGSIADSLDVSGGWAALYEANKKEIGSDPDHIVPGQTLDLSS